MEKEQLIQLVITIGIVATSYAIIVCNKIFNSEIIAYKKLVKYIKKMNDKEFAKFVSQNNLVQEKTYNNNRTLEFNKFNPKELIKFIKPETNLNAATLKSFLAVIVVLPLVTLFVFLFISGLTKINPEILASTIYTALIAIGLAAIFIVTKIVISNGRE